MKRLSILLVSVFIVFSICYGAYQSAMVEKSIGSTLTDTIGPFTAGDYYNLRFTTNLDLTASTTITQTITPMVLIDGVKKDIHAAITVASAITADGVYQTMLRNKDSVIVSSGSIFYLKRVTTVTGDSVTCWSYVSGWGE